MYQKVSTDLKFVDREKEVEKFWEENQIFEKSMENRKEGETYTFYDAYWSCSYPCYQRYDPEIPDHEREDGSEKGRMGYPRSAGRAGSRETSGIGRKGSDRRIRTGAFY